MTMAHYFLAERLGVRRNVFLAILCALLVAVPQATLFISGVDVFGNVLDAYQIAFPGIVTGVLTLVALTAS